MKNITKHPKPKHVAYDMPEALMIKHMSDQGPWLMYKLTETSG
jgi:hypothetical protein